MRRIIRSAVMLSMTLILLPRSRGECPPQVRACTANLAPGSPTYDDSVTDLTYRANLHQVWAIEGPLPTFNGLRSSRVTVFSEDLQTKVLSFNPNFSEPAFGIAEIPDGLPDAGKCYVLAPSDTVSAGPAIAVMEDNGSLAAGTQFIKVIDPITAKPPPGFYTAIDVHPFSAEIALYDSDIGRFVIVAPPDGVTSTFTVIRGPFLTEGLPVYFGGGIAYNSDSTVLVLSQFRSAFEGHLALEYDTTTGQYIGNAFVLDHPTSPIDDPMIPLGLDTGFLSGEPTIFIYNAFADSIYAETIDLNDAPGPAQGLNPACALDPDGRVRLSWTNNPAYPYQMVRVIENGVVVAVLPPTASEYLSPFRGRGKYEYCLETLISGSQNVLRVCCEGQSGAQLPFLPPTEKPGSEVIVDPLPNVNHFQLGIASRKVVSKKDDFLLYILGTYDNQVRVVDTRRQNQPIATIATQPLALSTVQNNTLTDIAASGIALIDLTIQGQKVPMYALLDGDGPTGNSPPQASFHFLQDTLLPGGEATIPAGTRYKDEITSIDFQGVEGFFFYDWDTDPAGDFIAVDYDLLRVFKFHYDPDAHTLRAVANAPLPMAGIPPFVDKNYALGAVTVLASGYYLVAGDHFMNTTVKRAYLMTPLDDDPGRSLKLIGPVEGLWSFSQFYSYDFLGRAIGPEISFGFQSVFFQEEGVGAMYYTLPHLNVTRRLGFRGNFLVGLTTSLAHPGLKAEVAFDDTASLGSGSTLDTGPLTPSFADQTPRIDYHYHIFNPSTVGTVDLKVHLFFDGAEAADLLEVISVPPGQGLYRVAENRKEKSFQLQAESTGAGSQAVRVLVGITGVKPVSGEPQFRRGDADLNAVLEITDPLKVLEYLFLSGQLSCADAADADDNGDLNINDPVYLLNWMFLAGQPIPDPGPETCGPDPTVDTLPDCVSTCQ